MGPQGVEGAPPLSRLRADLVLVLVTLLAALGWLLSRLAIRGLPPLLFMGSRFALAGLILAALSPREFRSLDRHHLRRALVTGVVFAAAVLLWVLGLSHAAQLGIGAFVNSVAVVLIPVVGWLFFRVEIARRTWAALAFGGAGLVLLSSRTGFRPATSDLFFVASALVSALHFNLNSRYAGRMPALALTAIQLGVVGVLGIPLSALLEPWPKEVAIPILVCVALSILLCTSLRFLMLVKAQSVAPVGHAALIMALEPVWTAGAAALLLGERMAIPQVIGCTLIVAALLLNRFGPSLPSFFSEDG
jgi:drug/metabolite transporter (DMT)-like permease